MKRVIIIPLLLISTLLFGTNYYVKNGGNDADTGVDDAHAWESITKVNTVWNAGTFAPGDSILFNRGDTFIGTITVKESGTSGHPIVISAYGTGDNPIITGWTDISGSWTSLGGNIYSKTVSTSSDIRYLTIGGTNRLMGRWPSSGFYTATANNTQYILTDATNLTQVDNYWVGGEIAYRATPYNRYVQNITSSSQTNKTITWTVATGKTTASGYGYFIQNHIACLLDNGDWLWDGTDIKMYYSPDPSVLTIAVSAYDYGIYINNYDYISIANISLSGYNKDAIYMAHGDYNYFGSSIIEYCVEAIYIHDADNITVEYDSIRYVGTYGVKSDANNYLTVNNNTIRQVGMDLGYFRGSDNESRGIGIQSYGGNYVNIYKNDISYTGYTGIYFAALNNSTCEQNRIRYANYWSDDGGGIYVDECRTGDATHGLTAFFPEALPFVADTVRYNYIEGDEGISARLDKPDMHYYGYGIYLDDYNFNIIINNNIIVKCSNNFHLNSPDSCTLSNNWTTKNRTDIYRGYELQISEQTSNKCNDLTLTGNKFVGSYLWNSINRGSWPLGLASMTGTGLEGTGNSSDNNYLLNATGQYSSSEIDDIVNIYSIYGGTGTYENITEWIADWGGANDKSDVMIWDATYGNTSRDEFVTYDYNFSDTPRSYDFAAGWTYYDITTGSVVTSLTLDPYEGYILYRLNDTDVPIPPSTNWHYLNYGTKLMKYGGKFTKR